MLDAVLKSKMEDYADQVTTGQETMDEAKDILRVMGIKFSNNQRED